MSSERTWLVLAVAVALAGCIITGMLLHQAYRTVSDREATIADLQQRVVQLETERISQDIAYSELDQRFQNLTSAHEDLATTNTRLSHDVTTATTLIDEYRTTLKSNLEWFKENAVLNDTSFPEYDPRAPDRIRATLMNRCTNLEDSKASSCTIKIPCIVYTNSQSLFLDYKTDVSVTGEEDALLPLREIVDNGGGDCEDYSLLFKAQINLLKSACGEEFNLETMEYTGENRYFPYYDAEGKENRDWFVQGYAARTLPAHYTHPVIVCGTVVEPDSRFGHCLIAFTQSPIRTVQDLMTQLPGAPLIEPQNGMYEADLSSTLKGTMFQSGGILLSLDTVITDEDLFLLSKTRGTWLSNRGFLAELDATQG